MNFAFVKDNTCINIAVFNDLESANAFEEVLRKDGVIDELIHVDNKDVNIGDIYTDGVWTKGEPPVIVETPTIEERLATIETTFESENLDRIEESVDHEFRLIELEFQLL